MSPSAEPLSVVTDGLVPCCVGTSSESAGHFRRINGLLSPRFTLASDAQGRSLPGRHFRWGSIGSDGSLECDKSTPPEIDGDVDIVEVEGLVSDETAGSTRSGGGLKEGGTSRSSHKQKKHRRRKDKPRCGTSTECSSSPQISVRARRRSSVSVESDSDQVLPLCCPRESEFAVPLDPETAKALVTPRRAISLEEKMDSAGTRKEKILQRSSRMSSLEIQSVMSSISTGGTIHSSPMPVIVHSSASLSVNCITPRTPMPSTPGFFGTKTSPSGSGLSSPVSPGSPRSGTVPSTPRLQQTLMSPKEYADDLQKSMEKPARHGHVFSLSILKGSRSGSTAFQRRGSGSNPASPLCGRTPVDERLFSMTLEDVLKDADLSAMFMSFLERKAATEGLEFLLRLEKLKSHEAQQGVDPYSLHEEAIIMYEFYIREGAQNELNLSSSTREDIETKLLAPKAEQLTEPSVLFKDARVEVFNMLGTNLYSQWLASLR